MSIEQYRELMAVDDNRFKKLLDSLDITDSCFDCSYFNPKNKEIYRCRVAGMCIDATLNPDLKSYLLWKTGLKSQKEHIEYIKRSVGRDEASTTVAS